jgi:hypothetical protein
MTNGEQVSSPFVDIVNPYLSPLSTSADLNFNGGIEFHIRSTAYAEKRSAEVCIFEILRPFLTSILLAKK